MKQEKTPFYIAQLLYKSLTNNLKAAEKEELNLWLSKKSNNKFYETLFSKSELEVTSELYKKSNKDKVYNRLKHVITPKESKPVFKLHFTSIIKYAALVLVFLAVSFGAYYMFTPEETQTVTVAPGKERATLILADGTEINLEEKTNAVLSNNGVIQIENSTNGLIYKTAKNNESGNGSASINTLVVPVGGIYQVQLADGSKVWLNSKSSLKFPEYFNESKRVVELQGEAYFEVEKNANKPFIVKTKEANIEVLGTQFNTSAYNDDPFFATTLVEGKVKVELPKTNSVKKHVVLSPGEQAVINKQNTNDIKVSEVNPKIFSAWKDGAFYFDNETLENILNKMSRWYNFKYQFKNEPLKSKVFKGVVLKDKPLKTIMEIISETANINYKIQQKNKVYEVIVY